MDTVVLIERDGMILLMPVYSNAAAGLMVKIRNSRGDRVIDAVDFLRFKNLDSDQEKNITVVWNKDFAGLVLRLDRELQHA